MHTFDEKFWLAVAFFSFVILIIKFVGPAISKSLGLASQKIVDELAKAKESRQKSEELLAKAEKYHQESVEYANKLIEDAKFEAQNLIKLTGEAIEAEVKKKTAAALERVKVEEERAIREIKVDVILTAVKMMNEQVSKEISETNHDHLMEQAINDLSKAVH